MPAVTRQYRDGVGNTSDVNKDWTNKDQAFKDDLVLGVKDKDKDLTYNLQELVQNNVQ